MNCHFTFLRFALMAALFIALSTPAQAQPVSGYVDLHSHLAAHLAFGGGWFWGTVEGSSAEAVHRCDGNLYKSHGATIIPFLADKVGNNKYGSSGDTGWHLFKRNGDDTRRCMYFRLGPFRIPIPGTCPKPDFKDWPRWDSLAHQQMWHGWLRQAHEGGLRIMVISLMESEFLCDNTALQSRRYGCNEMESVRRQALYIQGFATRNNSWVGIASTPAQARALIAQGKLALVLAVEVTKLFPQGDFIQQLDELRALGVVSVQLTHHANNRFAGTAPIPELMKGADDIEKAWNILSGGVITDMTAIDDTMCWDNNRRMFRECDGNDSLNIQGLTVDGRALVTAMMDRGMLLDVAHVSRKAFRQMYEMAHQRGDYPLFSSHSHLWDTISGNEERHEKYIQSNEIPMITSTGGMIGLRPGPEETIQYANPGSTVANRCPGSSRSFAQSLMYAVDRGLSVGFGADMNGFIQQLRPRFRLDCINDFNEIAWAGGPTPLQEHGLGNIGMLPQLIGDLRAVGVPQHYLDHLNNSAERFLQMWERSVSLGTGSNSNLARLAGTSASSTYCVGTGVHCYSSTRVNDGDRSTALGGFSSWVNAYGTPMPQGLELAWGSPVTVSRVELYTTSGYELRDYDIQYWTGSGWTSVIDPARTGQPTVTGNTSVSQTHTVFPPVTTDRLRVLGYQGPDAQPGYVRINEIEVY
jgi:microsomal dipeptidase-like Zn-dependent dipeptidase